VLELGSAFRDERGCVLVASTLIQFMEGYTCDQAGTGFTVQLTRDGEMRRDREMSTAGGAGRSSWLGGDASRSCR
jgi:hypothetical protein